jgi:hypothetical protein
MLVPIEQMRIAFINPATAAPFSKKAFMRIFREELEQGRMKLRTLIATKYVDALRKGAPWAIKAGLRQRFGWSLEGGSPLTVIEDAIEGARAKGIEVSFCLPEPQPIAPPVDIIPPAYADAKPDPSRPALPPPPERRRGPLGWLEERPGSGQDW